MPADTSHLVVAARRRAAAARRRAIAALRRMDAHGDAVTFQTLAREADVSRSWLSTQPDLRADLERRRTATQSSPRPTPPKRQRCSDPSLRQRLELATARIRELDADNKQLRQALAQALGNNRLITSRAPRHDTPNSSIPQPVPTPPPPASKTPYTTQNPRSERRP